MLILTRLMAALSQKKQSGSRCHPRYLIRRSQFGASQQIWGADVTFGSRLCENTKAINRDRTTYLFKIALGAQIAMAFNFGVERKNIILVSLRTFEFSHRLGQQQNLSNRASTSTGLAAPKAVAACRSLGSEARHDRLGEPPHVLARPLAEQQHVGHALRLERGQLACDLRRRADQRM